MRALRSRLGPLLFTSLVLVASCAAPAAGPAPAAPAKPAGAPAAAAPTQAGAPTAAAVAPTAVPRLGRVRYGTQQLANFAPVFLAEERGYFRQEGIETELINFGNSSEILPALATDQIDAAGFSTNAAVWNSVARGVQQKLVLEQGSYRPGYGSTSFVVRKDVWDAGRGRRLEDLRGLSLAFTPPGKPTGNGCAASAGLRRVGMTLDDLDITPVPFPDMVPALANGSVDGAVIAEPFFTRVTRQNMAVKLAGLDELYPNFTIAVVAFSSSLYGNRPLAKGVVRAYLQAVREYAAVLTGQPSGLSRADIDQIIAKHTNTDVNVLRDLTPNWYSVNGLPNRESLLYCYNFFRDLGLVPEPVSEAAFAALWGDELVEEVLREIGRQPES
jgi:NitT/TauT family transport system substrate-binding protein